MSPLNISPKWIKSLAENEIFVFGSNLAGFHGGGACHGVGGGLWAGEGIGNVYLPESFPGGGS